MALEKALEVERAASVEREGWAEREMASIDGKGAGVRRKQFSYAVDERKQRKELITST